MKRLLFILSHTDLTGVNTFNYTVIKSIKEIYNYDIDVYLLNSGNSILAKKLSEYSNIVNEVKDIYDIAYFNYEQETGFYDILKKADKRFFVHGLMTKSNLPQKQYDKIYCFGERSFNFVHCDNKELIRNYVDMDRFKFSEPVENYDKILVHSSRDSQILLTPIMSAANKLGAYVGYTGNDFLQEGKIWKSENYISNSNVVIGYGRCAIEAMAMGKSVIIYGINGGDGHIGKSNFWKCAETNFSGWSIHNLKFDISRETVDSIANELLKVNYEDIIYNYNQVKEHFDIKKHIHRLV